MNWILKKILGSKNERDLKKIFGDRPFDKPEPETPSDQKKEEEAEEADQEISEESTK